MLCLIVVVLLVILLFFFFFNKNDGYHPVHSCQTQCANVSGQNQRQACVEECLGDTVLQYGGQKCSVTSECSSGQVCVLGGPYSGFENNGVCMDQNDPGVVKWMREGYGPLKSCLPTQYYNFLSGECVSRYQGPNTAYSVMHEKPEPPVHVTIPGTTLNDYGVGEAVPYDVLTNVTIS